MAEPGLRQGTPIERAKPGSKPQSTEYVGQRGACAKPLRVTSSTKGWVERFHCVDAHEPLGAPCSL